MTDFIQGENRYQSVLFPESLDEYVAEDNAVRVIDVFIDELDLSGLGFKDEPKAIDLLRIMWTRYWRVGTTIPIKWRISDSR